MRELHATLGRSRAALERGTRRALDRERQRLATTRERLTRAPALALERKRAVLNHAAARLQALSPRSTLARGYSIVRSGDELVRSTATVAPGDPLRIEVADGSFGARVE